MLFLSLSAVIAGSGFLFSLKVFVFFFENLEVSIREHKKTFFVSKRESSGLVIKGLCVWGTDESIRYGSKRKLFQIEARPHSTL